MPSTSIQNRCLNIDVLPPPLVLVGTDTGYPYTGMPFNSSRHKNSNLIGPGWQLISIKRVRFRLLLHVLSSRIQPIFLGPGRYKSDMTTSFVFVDPCHWKNSLSLRS